MYKNLDNQELARRCSQGDRLAEDELYIRYAAKVYTLCRRYLENDSGGEVVGMDSRVLSTYSSEHPWMFTVATGVRINIGK